MPGMAGMRSADEAMTISGGTTHSQLTAEQLEAAHLSEDLIRLSVGIEDERDIIADLGRAIAAATGKEA